MLPVTSPSKSARCSKSAGARVPGMKIEGIHHVTCITGDAPGNVDFYARVLGLRMVKRTVNQDDPTVYHLFYADEAGSAGAGLSVFEDTHPPARGAGGGGGDPVAPPRAAFPAPPGWGRPAGARG